MSVPLLQIGQSQTQTTIDDIQRGIVSFDVELSGDKYLSEARRIDKLFEKYPELTIIIGKSSSGKEYKAKVVTDGSFQKIKIYSRINGREWKEAVDENGTPKNIQEVSEEVHGEHKIPSKLDNGLFSLNTRINRGQLELKDEAAIDLAVLVNYDHPDKFTQADIDKTTQAVKDEKPIKVSFEKSVEIPDTSPFKPSIALLIDFFKQNPDLQIRIGKYLLKNEDGKITIYEIENGKIKGKSDKDVHEVSAEQFTKEGEKPTYFPRHFEAVLAKLLTLQFSRVFETLPVPVKTMVLKVVGEKAQNEVDPVKLNQVVTLGNLKFTAKMRNILDATAKHKAATPEKKPVAAYKIKTALVALTAEERKNATPADTRYVIKPAEDIVADEKDAIAAEEKKRAIAPTDPAGQATKGKSPSKYTQYIYVLSTGTSVFENGGVKISDVTDDGKFKYNGKEIDLNDGIGRNEAKHLGLTGVAYNFFSSGGNVYSTGDEGMTAKDIKTTRAEHIDEATKGLSEADKKAAVKKYFQATGYILVPAKEASKKLMGKNTEITAEELVHKHVSKANRATARRVIANILGGGNYNGNKELDAKQLQSFLATMGFLSQIPIKGYKVDTSSLVDKAPSLLSNVANFLAWLNGGELKEDAVDEATGVSVSDLRGKKAEELWMEKQALLESLKTDKEKLETLLKEKKGFFAQNT
ncbi:MAG: hypothetical protein ABIB61_00510, partial [Candidatus Shapirobacteria bacterium]